MAVLTNVATTHEDAGKNVVKAPGKSMSICSPALTQVFTVCTKSAFSLRAFESLVEFVVESTVDVLSGAQLKWIADGN